MSQSAARPAVPRRRRRFRRAAVAVAAVVVVAVAAVAVFALVLAHTFDANRRTIADPFPASTARPAAPTGAAAKAVNVLLLGTDVDTVDPESPQTVGKQESDTMILLHVPADRRHLWAVSIPRNALVPVAGHGRRPINEALADGGTKLAVQAVEGLLGTRVDHVVQISLTRFAGLTDALGGVTVQNPVAFTTHGVDFPAGAVRLDGARARVYVRAGDFRASGDAQRIRAQTAYFRAVFDQLLSAKTLLDPVTLSAVVSYVSPYVSVDRGFDSSTVASLGLGLRSLRAGDLVFVTVPSTGVSRHDGAEVVDLDAPATRRLAAHLHTDTMGAWTG